MNMILKENGELTKGFEILARQLLKMLNLDPQSTLDQINGIHGLMVRHVEQQDEIIRRLERIENGYRGKPETVSPDGTVERKLNGSAQQSE